MQYKIMNTKGFTMVEVIIALVVLLIVFLALMHTALISLDANTRNLIRDEAVGITDSKITELRNLGFSTIPAGTYTEVVPARKFRTFWVTFSSSRTITDLNTDSKQATVSVTWNWRGEWHTHSGSTVLRKQ